MDAQYIDVVRGGVNIQNVVSREDAGKIMNLAFESGFHDKRVQMFAGDRERATFWDAKLATLIWSRIQKFVKPIYHDSACDEYNSTCGKSPCTGHYEPVGLNPFMRISKYEAGQSFRWHSDSVYGTSDDNLGFQTLLLYLNDDFRGGETSFRVWEDVEDATIVTVVPVTGSALIFDHAQEHQGNLIHEGRKIVLRTEVMFTLVPR
jgi:hypothetical protein